LPVTVRRAGRDDAGFVDGIINEYWKVSVDHVKELSNSDAVLLVAEEPAGSRAIVGAATMWVTAWNRAGYLVELAVRKDWQRKGVGKAMVGELARLSKERGLRAIIAETQPENRNAIDFYMANGFRMCGYNDRYYTNRPSSSKEIALFFSLDVE
jgi:ribosomal protein S18 acetylase RimI-like enzyme